MLCGLVLVPSGTVILGIILFAEPPEMLRLRYILLIVIGIAGLRLLG